MSVEQRDRELVNGYCSGNLTNVEFLELEDRLRESSQLRQLLVEYRSIETALPSALPAGPIHGTEPSKPSGGNAGWWNRRRVLAVAAVVVVVLAAGVLSQLQERPALNSDDSQSVAVVTDSVGAYREEGIAIRSGQIIKPGPLTIERGIVRLDFARGARVAIEGPAEIEVVDEMRVVLLSGVITATIPESAIGFVVDTDTARVVDLGTAFGVSVGDHGTTDVCVFEGEVTVRRKGSTANKSALVREGEAVRASESSRTIDFAEYEVAAFENAWPVNSGVLQTTGSIRFVSPGPDFHPGNYEDNEHIVVFPEGQAVTPNESIRVDMVDPGEYAKSRYQEKRTLPPGRQVSSYLLQFDAFPTGPFPNRKRSVRGQITF